MVKQLKRAMCRFTLTVALVFITLAGPAAADLEPVRLEKTVVTASRTEADLSMVPASVEVVTEDEIEARSANRIRDILKLSTGVNLQQKEPVIRGFKGEHSIVMIDGKRIAGEVSHSFELNRITTENIERIEIVRGADERCLRERCPWRYYQYHHKKTQKVFL
ncbi:MAG: Plug domain-containing protein [Thermodesulfobacteriota bacterium]|nr:Plug domain-containing protein [Thermodesulfobacteriota bacterium]